MSDIHNQKMADTDTSIGTTTPLHEKSTSAVPAPEITHEHAQGRPWMYKKYKIGPITIPHYASPQFQIVFVALVCFLCPGMFNAVSGLGAGGGIDAHTIDNATTALYSTFAGIGFFAGSIANTIGLRLTLGIGGFGYCIYVVALLVNVHDAHAGSFVIIAGAVLGLCAGMLWTAQGAVMMSYPPERSKGKYIAAFWMIFNLGGVLGALIPLGQNLHSTAGGVNDGTYIAFIVLMACGFALAIFLCNPKFVVRNDGSRIIMMKNPTWKSEILGLLRTLMTDWYIVLLFPMFFASNWFYTYHFQDVNLPKFNIRTRALNNVLYWLFQIVGAGIAGVALDVNVRRTLRAKAVLVTLFALTMAIWGGGYAFQKTYTRASTDPDSGFVPMDFTDSGYVGPMFLYLFYGFFDATWQTSVYWLMGSLTNNSRKLANYAGFYKGVQSAGAAIASRIDALKAPYMNEFASNWGLLAGSLLIAAPVILLKVRDTVPIEEDVKFTDEAVEEVAPTGAVVGAEVRMAEKNEASI